MQDRLSEIKTDINDVILEIENENKEGESDYDEHEDFIEDNNGYDSVILDQSNKEFNEISQQIDLVIEKTVSIVKLETRTKLESTEEQQSEILKELDKVILDTRNIGKVIKQLLQNSKLKTEELKEINKNKNYNTEISFYFFFSEFFENFSRTRKNLMIFL